MQKIPTLFVRDDTKNGRPVTDQVAPGCQWVLDGEGWATVKYDGTNVKIDGGNLFKRQKPKDRDYDDAAYVPCDRANPADRWAFEGLDAAGTDPLADGIYELVGPKVQGNPYHLDGHRLIRVVPHSSDLVIREVPHEPRTFAQLRAFLTMSRIEGIVFHHPDGRMAKIKRRDYGLPWPVSTVGEPAQTLGAVDPHACSTGPVSTRGKTSSSSLSSSEGVS